MSERIFQSEREREAVERAPANEALMRQERDARAAIDRGEKGIPGKVVQEEARRQRG